MPQSIPLVDKNSWIVYPVGAGYQLPEHFETLTVDRLTFGRCIDGRFIEDRCLVEEKDLVLLLDGVILNRTELLEEHNTTSIANLMFGLIRREGLAHALAHLRGVFSGALLDRKTGVLHGFGNQTGESAAFEYSGTNGPALSSNFDLLMRLLHSSGAPITFDDHAARVMLSYGFMVDDHTFATEVKRIAPGQMSSHRPSQEPVRSTYWKLTLGRREDIITPQDATTELDRIFRRAVQRCLDKDLEYGYENHLIDMSAGLDSRMVNIVARDLGYKQVTNLTYSESDSDENRYAIRLADKLGNLCLYYPLDSGRALLEPRETLKLNSGLAYYAGSTGAKKALEAINFDRFGLETTGLIGDSVISTSSQTARRNPATQGKGAYSSLTPYSVEMHAPDEELFFMETNAFRGMCSSALLRQHFTFSVSPYSDVDLLDLMFSIPLRWRVNYRLYGQWIAWHYPKALQIPTTNHRLPLRTDPLGQTRARSKYAVSRLKRTLRRILSRRHAPIWMLNALTARSMHPMDRWVANNSDLQKLVEDCRSRASLLPFSPTVRHALERSFGTQGGILDRLMAVTVVTMHELYFSPERSGGRHSTDPDAR